MDYKPDEVFLVTRAYQTRHGNGPITNEGLPLDIRHDYEVATRENRYQGSLRKTVLDLDQIESVVARGLTEDCVKHSITRNLVVTCLDQVLCQPALTHHGKLVLFQDGVSFARYIAKVLGVDGKIYGNYSPCSETIKELV